MSALTIANHQFDSNLIQGPLAGFSCAPYRQLFSQFKAPAYCVSEMLSAIDVIKKHQTQGRYLSRHPSEKKLCYQLSGTDPVTVSQAAKRLQDLGADLIDLNCGCPKGKIRKKGAGSALLSQPKLLMEIISATKQAISIGLTVKIRINEHNNVSYDIDLARQVEQAGADALIVHGRSWQQDYDIGCNYQRIKQIKNAVKIPVIANGDIKNKTSLAHAIKHTGCDGFMISRAGTGAPWLYQQLLSETPIDSVTEKRLHAFIDHIEQLAQLEDDFKALLQSRKLLGYYFKNLLTPEKISSLFQHNSLASLFEQLKYLTLPTTSNLSN